jgi:hypothetical protein
MNSRRSAASSVTGRETLPLGAKAATVLHTDQYNYHNKEICVRMHYRSLESSYDTQKLSRRIARINLFSPLSDVELRYASLYHQTVMKQQYIVHLRDDKGKDSGDLHGWIYVFFLRENYKGLCEWGVVEA